MIKYGVDEEELSKDTKKDKPKLSRPQDKQKPRPRPSKDHSSS